jgi:hypothetical protein
MTSIVRPWRAAVGAIARGRNGEFTPTESTVSHARGGVSLSIRSSREGRHAPIYIEGDIATMRQLAQDILEECEAGLRAAARAASGGMASCR